MKFWIPIICFLSIFSSTYAQEDTLTVIDKITDYYNNNQRDSALMLIETSIPYYESIRAYDTLSNLYRQKAIVYAAVNTPADALEVIRQAIEISDNHLNPIHYESLMNQIILGTITQQNYRFDEAIEIFESVLPQIDKIQDSDHYNAMMTRVTNNLGWIYYNKREYTAAKRYARRSLELTLMEYDSLDRPLTYPYQTLGSIYIFTSQYDSAKIYLQLQTDVAKKNFPPDHPNIGIALNGLASVYLNTDDYDIAKKLYEEEEQIFYQDFLKTGNLRYLGIVYQNLGYLYLLSGDHLYALKYLRKSQDLSTQEFGANNLIHVSNLSKIATSLIALDQTEEAKESLDEAYSIQLELGPQDLGGIALLDMQYAALYDHEGDWENMYYYAEKAHKYYSQAQIDHKMHLAAKTSMARAAARIDPSKALPLADESIELANSLYSPNHRNTVNAHLVKSIVLNTLGDVDGAQQSLFEIFPNFSVDLDTLRYSDLPPYPVISSVYLHQAKLYVKLLDQGKIRFQQMESLLKDFYRYYSAQIELFQEESSIHLLNQDLRSFFNIYIDICFQYDNAPLALQIIENYKSSFLSIILHNNLIDHIKQLPQPVQNRKAQLENQLRKSSISLTEDTLKNPEPFFEYYSAKQAFLNFKDSITEIYPTLYAQKYTDQLNIDWSKITSSQETILEYYISDSLLYRIEATPEAFTMDRTAWYPIKDQIRALITSDYQNQKILKDLREQLIPAETTGSSYIIIPDDLLNYLNFEMLIDENDHYVIEESNFRYGYSIQALSLQKDLANHQKPEKIISFTPGFTEYSKEQYLSETNIHNIDSFYLYMLQQPFMLRIVDYLKNIASTEHKTELEATESAFKAISKGYEVIHLGTHGIIDDRSPLMSRLIFSKSPLDSLEDGYLHTYEIYNQRLDAELAILAACNSGKAHENNVTGEGIQSLAHAFTYAGCPSQIVSLWNIDEQVNADILQHFYHYIQKGLTKSQALRKAKLDYLSEAPVELRAPNYWAGLIFLGEDSTLEMINHPNYIQWILIVALILAIVFLGRQFFK